MSIDATDIRLGVCDVTFKGSDLGSTKGGVEVSIETSTYEVKVDQAGETPLKEIITGTMVTVKVPMAETNLTRLQTMMAQSVASAAAGGMTASAVDLLAGYAVGTSVIAIDVPTGTVAVGQTFTFADHATVYRVVSYDAPSLTFVQDASGTGGLVAPVADGEVITGIAKTAGVEIRSGVNTDLITVAGELLLHPTGAGSDTEGDFTLFLASPVPNFSFKYELAAERIYEVTFKGYVDTANNNRIAAFGNPS